MPPESLSLEAKPTVADAARKPVDTLDTRYFQTGEVFERPPAERPRHDTVDAIIDWLGGPAGQIPTLAEEFDEFSWRMVAAGFPLLRTTFHLRTLHPQYLGATFVWWRTTGQTVQTYVTHEVQDLYGHEDNPVRRVLIDGETLRRRVDLPDDQLDFPILHDLKAAGATDYFALPLKSSFGTNYMATYVTDRPGGFTEQEIAELTRVTRRLPLFADLRNHRRIASNILNAYLGPKTGPKVLAGQIRRGTGEEITAVLWTSDLRGFTELSDRLTGIQVIAMLNALFEAQAQAIATHGGEILKFIGDGLLAIFPIEHPGKAATAARCALDAALQAVEAARGLNARSAAGWRAAAGNRRRAAYRHRDLRQYRRRRPARFHRDRTRRQSGQPDRERGQNAECADHRQRRFRRRLWQAAASARPSRAARTGDTPRFVRADPAAVPDIAPKRDAIGEPASARLRRRRRR